MTSTSEERRKVAERMRVYSHDFDFGDSDPFWYVAKAAFGDVDVHTGNSVFARLADLIDPTCDVKTRHDYGATTLRVCSECGWPIVDDMSYCPGCGARVVDDE